MKIVTAHLEYPSTLKWTLPIAAAFSKSTAIPVQALRVPED
jgi:hypothetical protein